MVMRLTNRQKASIVFFFSFMFVLSVSFNGCTPSIYRAFPNDYARTRLILNTLGDTTCMPEIVIFGNSRGMSGVDGYRLEEKLEGHPVVCSFTSTGQKLNESILYYSSLPSSVKKVIQCVDIDRMSSPADELDLPNRIALHMYGYEMDEVTRTFLPGLHERMSYPDVCYNYEARSCLFMGLASWVRDWLDDDVAAGMLETELRYPNSSTSDRNEILYRHSVEEQNQENVLESFHVREEWVDLIKQAHTFLKHRGVDYYLVVMPYNPDITSMSDSDKERALQLFKEKFSFVPVVDCMERLSASDFYDAIHPNRKGAVKITDLILSAVK